MALPYNGKLALVLTSKKIGFIDAEGKYIINPQFNYVSPDLEPYLLDDWSYYGSVETDYFNITSIVNRININNPEGLSLSCKLSDVVAKLKITENEFSKYSTGHLVIKNEKITNDASVGFYVIASAYKEIPDGWYTQQIFNPDAIVQRYLYKISLSGKGKGKEKEVKDAIEKTFTGYNKDETKSTEAINIFKNESQTIRSYIENSHIMIDITNNINETNE